jgi:hypothetical protein
MTRTNTGQASEAGARARRASHGARKDGDDEDGADVGLGARLSRG